MLKKSFAALFSCILILSFFSGCAPKEKKELRALRVGSLTFTENILLAEIQKELIETNLGYTVEHIPNFSASNSLHQAMLNGELDLSTRYLGTDLSGALALNSYPHDSAAAFALLRDEFNTRFNQTVFAPLGFNNTYAFTLRRETIDQLGLQKVSDLSAHASQLKLGTDTTWLERPTDGYSAFCTAYGFNFQATEAMEVALLYNALRNKSIDVALTYSTDPRLKTYDFVLLADDRRFFPPYDALIIARSATLAAYPGLREELSRLSGSISNADIVYLSSLVDEQKITAKQAARDFLLQKKLLQK